MNQRSDDASFLTFRESIRRMSAAPGIIIKRRHKRRDVSQMTERTISGKRVNVSPLSLGRAIFAGGLVPARSYVLRCWKIPLPSHPRHAR
jgi:hypothetical protein